MNRTMHTSKKRGTYETVSYRCGTYVRSGMDGCTPHSILERVISQIVVDDIRAKADLPLRTRTHSVKPLENADRLLPMRRASITARNSMRVRKGLHSSKRLSVRPMKKSSSVLYPKNSA